jgi:hypothetical protein
MSAQQAQGAWHLKQIVYPQISSKISNISDPSPIQLNQKNTTSTIDSQNNSKENKFNPQLINSKKRNKKNSGGCTHNVVPT